MHALVLAAGAGSRLAAAGIATPKPFVEVAHRPLLLALLEVLDELGCESVTCLTRHEHVGVARRLAAVAARAGRRRATVLGCSTPSSLHTLALGLASTPPGPVLCAMVDTVMRRRDWAAVYTAMAADLASGVDAALVVTPFVDDERPLFVAAGPDRRVTAVGEVALVPVRVTGGVYGLGPEARRLCRALVDQGRSRVRSLLAAMVARGLAVTAIEVARIIDVDRPADIEVANHWLDEAGSGGEIAS